MHRCFIDSGWLDRYLAHENPPVPPEVLHRLLKVVRLKKGELCGLFDGNGREIIGVLDEEMKLIKQRLVVESAPKPQIILLQAAIEESKLSETLKRGTEFGIDEFIIWDAQKSEPFILNKLKKREERLINVVVDAARQSGRLFVPRIAITANLSHALENLQRPFFGILGDINASAFLSDELKTLKYEDAIYMAVGPEGGLSSEEIKLLKAQSFRGVRFAPYTIRSEVAALAATAIINAALGKA